MSDRLCLFSRCCTRSIELANLKVWFEPTDVKKACKLFDAHPKWKEVLHFVSPNVKELFTMAKYFSITESNDIPPDEEVKLIREVSEKLAEHIPIVITTMGAEGVLVVRKGAKSDTFYKKNSAHKLSLIETGNIQSRLYPPPIKINNNSDSKKYSASGCGDCLTAGVIVGILKGFNEEACVTLGLRAAQLSLESVETVPATLRYLR